MPRPQTALRTDSRIIAVYVPTALALGKLLANAERDDFALSVSNRWIAATAQVRGLTLANRNTEGFENLGILLLNPWLGE